MRDRYEIDPEQPLPEFTFGGSGAFAAADLRDGGNTVIAILPDRKLPLRLGAIARLRRLDNINLQRTLAWDVVDWPVDGRRHPVIVLERPHGPRLFASPDARLEPLNEELLVRRFLQPLCTVLEDLAFVSIVHRNIRADNLYSDGTGINQLPIMLGECVSAPCGYLQPTVYETIECGMAYPDGRGEGGAANDFYALGVTAAILLAGRNPLFGMTDQEIIEKKLVNGSYAALVSGSRMPTNLVEVFRGLLNDDPSERWGLEELQVWLGGRRGSPKQQPRPNKSSKPLEIAGRPYFTARGVAEALSQHWDEGLGRVQSGEVDDWLRRGLADEDRIDAVNAAKAIKPDEAIVSDPMLARVCIALDPLGPFRLRNLRAMPDGVSMVLACRFSDEQVRADFMALIQEHLLVFCLEMNTRRRPDTLRLAATYERLSSLVARDDIGFGIERALYTLNPEAPCFSPFFDGDYVADLEQLLPALDRLVKAKGSALDSLIDRQIAAFIAARLKAQITLELREMRDAKDHFEFALPAARILSYVQEQVSGEPVPALCRAIATMLEPALERFHSRNTQDQVRARLLVVAETGRLDDLIAVADDQDALRIDEDNFRTAVDEYSQTIQQLHQIDHERENRMSISRTISSQVASLLSGVAATVVVLVTILAKLI